MIRSMGSNEYRETQPNRESWAAGVREQRFATGKFGTSRELTHTRQKGDSR